MTIRPLEKDDIPAVEYIYNIYWEGKFREHISKRLHGYSDGERDILKQGFVYFVAEDDNEVVGVIGFRKAPEHMKEFATSDNLAEIYIFAVKVKGMGIGKSLIEKVVGEMKASGFSEAVLYSDYIHKNSWGFYDHYGFEKMGKMTAPDGEPGFVWRLDLK